MPKPLDKSPFTPTVSVLIRSMDRPYLQQALDSVAIQTWPHIELVLVAALPDHTPPAAHCGPHPVVFVPTTKKLGRSAAANVALQHAQGDYLMFLDDDDWLHPNHISRLLAVLEKQPQVHAAYTGVVLTDQAGQPLQQVFDLPFDFTQQRGANLTPLHAVLFRSLVLSYGIRFNEQMDLYEDWDFWLQLAQITTFSHLPGVSASYRIHDSSGVHKDNADTQEAKVAVQRSWLGRLPVPLEDVMMRVVAYNDLEQRMQQAQQSLKISLEEQHHELHVQLSKLRDACHAQSVDHEQQLAERDAQLAERNAQLAARNAQLAERDAQLAERDAQLAERDAQLAERNAQLAERDVQLAISTAEAQALRGSRSWRITRPMRMVGEFLRKIHACLEVADIAIAHAGGIRPASQKFRRVLQQDGLGGIWMRLQSVRRGMGLVPLNITEGQPVGRNNYAAWVQKYDTLNDDDRVRIRAHIAHMDAPPLISVLMPTYNPKPQWLSEAIASVQGQLYPNWELCIADDASTDSAIRPLLERFAASDPRIKVTVREKNGHISAASNSALAMATGSWVALLDHDDLLAEHALYCVADTILKQPKARMIYSDEDKISESGLRQDPYFKSDWNPDLFYSHNMFCHLGSYHTELVRHVGGFREGFEGAQDYDLALRCIECIDTSHIAHIPRVLYHWRVHSESTAGGAEAKPYAMLAGERAINDHFKRSNITAQACLVHAGYKATHSIPEPAPLVSILIPTRDQKAIVEIAVQSILRKTNYTHYEILILDNDSTSHDTLKWFSDIQMQDHRVKVIGYKHPFNYSAINNFGVAQAKGEIICLVNNDVEVISADWLSELVSHALRPEIGCVGAKLYYPNETLQHGGVVLGIGGVAGHAHKHFPRSSHGYFGRAALIQNFSAVTAACLAVRKAVFVEVGGLDEEHLTVAFNDVDFCLKVQAAGYRNLWTPYAELYHHESLSRGLENTPEKQARFNREVHFMCNKWGDSLRHDPCYNPNLSVDHEDFSLAWPPRVLPL